MARSKHVAVVGAGPTGLAAAFQLQKEGCQVSVFESQGHAGGLIKTLPLGDTRIEQIYCHTFVSDKDLIALIDEVGLSGRLLWKEPKNAIYSKHKIYPFSSPLDLLNFKTLPFLSRIKLGMLTLKAKRENNWEKLDKMSAKEWVIKNAGKAAYAVVWEPLLAAKFDLEAENISAAWLCNKLKLRGSSRSQAMQKEKLGYLKGSFGVLYEVLAEKIKNRGGHIYLNQKVKKITAMASGEVKIDSDRGSNNFAAVILTCPPAKMHEIIDFPLEYQSRLKKIRYKSNICMFLQMQNPVSNYYWMSVAEKESPFVSVIEHTNFMADGGYHSNVVFLSRYLDENDPLFSAPDETISGLFVGYLKKIFPDLRESDIEKTHIAKSQYAQPVVSVGYQDMIPAQQTPIKNIYLACMAQIYPEDRGQNYSVRMGKNIANIAAKD